MDGSAAANPLLEPFADPFGIPPFERIEAGHFRPAFAAALAAEDGEIAAIAANGAPPDFENTIAALERSGGLLERVSAVFFSLAGAHTSEALQAVERETAPALARHASAIYLNDDLFRRVDAVHRDRHALGLDPEQVRVVERYHRIFRRTGAGLPAETRDRLAAIGERLAVLGTRFSQNVLADEQAFALPLGEEDLAGLPADWIAAAREAGAERGLDRPVLTLARSSVEPFLQFAERRDLRRRAFEAWTGRGEGERDNRPLVAETVRLRAERARLLGFPTFAHFKLDDTMAGTPEAASGLLRSVWTPAVALARHEAAALGRLPGSPDPVEAWDWRFLAETRRRQLFATDAAAAKPYLPLDRMIAAAFDCAARLFGLAFVERPDLPRYHPDVRIWEVSRDGNPVGLFVGDYFARSSKRSGAWMSAVRRQRKLDGPVRPIVLNVMNFAKGSDAIPALLSFDDARTLFHEFGHALHGLLSDVTYPAIAGTSVPRDFVEFPSQVYEHWLEQPEVLRRFARHHRTGEPMPDEMIERLLASRTFNQGFSTVEYTASALVDLAFHLLPEAEDLDVGAFERRTLAEIGMPHGITMRHRTPHFTHVFAGDGYAAGYYSYMWSEVLDADGFEAFREAGDIFDRDTARRLHDYVYSAGDRREPEEAYWLFRGRLPAPDALMRRRGLVPVAPEGES